MIDWISRNIVGVVIGLLLVTGLVWMFIRAYMHERRLEYLIKTGQRPEWLKFDGDETPDTKWTLSDGTKVWGAANESDISEKGLISAVYRNAVSPDRTIDCRYRMLAPDPDSWTNWERMHVPPPNEDGSEPKRFISIELPQGKYAVEYRFQTSSGEFEECSGVTMIVSRAEDYEA